VLTATPAISQFERDIVSERRGIDSESQAIQNLFVVRRISNDTRECSLTSSGGTFHLDEESAYRTNGVPKFPENGFIGNFNLSDPNLPISRLFRHTG
jgi:hypothetical protein